MPDRVTEQGPYTYELWKWAWVAAMVTGVIVWGLIVYAVVKFRRRSDDEVPGRRATTCRSRSSTRSRRS